MNNVAEHEPQPRRGRFALGLLALVFGVVAAAQLVNTDENAAERQRPEPTASPRTSEATAVAPTATATAEAPDLEVRAAPTPIFVPGSPADVLIPPPTSVPNAPNSANFHSALLAGGHLLVPEPGGVWLRPHRESNWSFLRQPRDLQQLGCPSVFGDKVAFTARSSDRTSQHLVVLDIQAQSWAVSRFPRLDADGQIRQRPDFCNGIMVNDQWVFALTYLDRMFFAVSSDSGATFEQRSIAFPDEWDRTSGALSTYVDLIPGDGRFVANVCVFHDYESRCGVNAMVFDTAPFLGPAQDSIAWAEASTMVMPSERYGGRFVVGLTGTTPDGYAFEVSSVGGQLWRSELRQVTGTLNRVEEYDVGIWSAGPIDQPPIPLPIGFRPRLFAYGDDVVAQVPLAPDGVGSLASPLVESQWWLLTNGSQEWRQMTTPPLIEWHSLYAQDKATLVSVTDSATLVVPSEELHGPWRDEADYFGDIVVVGDHLFAVDNEGTWASPDRGRSWTRTLHPDDAAPDPAGHCLAAYGDQTAFTTEHVGAWVNTMAHLVIEDTRTGERITVNSPESPTPGDYRTRFVGCRPVRIDDTWLAANLDVADAVLTLISTSGDGRATERRIDLTGIWSDALSPSSGGGMVNLYRDADWIIAQICSQGYTGDCQNTDLVFHRRLLDMAPSNVISAQLMHQQDEPWMLLPNPSANGAADGLVQLGTELWRADTTDAVGEYNYGEGITEPIFLWTGGRYNGPTSELFAPVRGRPSQGRERSGPGLFFRYNGRVMSCGFFNPDSPEQCASLEAGTWQPFLGNIAVDWLSVPAGTDVTFSHRTDDGRIMVVATN